MDSSAARPSPAAGAISSEQIQRCLDENQHLIAAILENQNSNRLAECLRLQHILQQNLAFLSMLADFHPSIIQSADPGRAPADAGRPPQAPVRSAGPPPASVPAHNAPTAPPLQRPPPSQHAPGLAPYPIPRMPPHQPTSAQAPPSMHAGSAPSLPSAPPAVPAPYPSAGSYVVIGPPAGPSGAPQMTIMPKQQPQPQPQRPVMGMPNQPRAAPVPPPPLPMAPAPMPPPPMPMAVAAPAPTPPPPLPLAIPSSAPGAPASAAPAAPAYAGGLMRPRREDHDRYFNLVASIGCDFNALARQMSWSPVQAKSYYQTTLLKCAWRMSRSPKELTLSDLRREVPELPQPTSAQLRSFLEQYEAQKKAAPPPAQGRYVPPPPPPQTLPEAAPQHAPMGVYAAQQARYAANTVNPAALVSVTSSGSSAIAVGGGGGGGGGGVGGDFPSAAPQPQGLAMAPMVPPGYDSLTASAEQQMQQDADVRSFLNF